MNYTSQGGGYELRRPMSIVELNLDDCLSGSGSDVNPHNRLYGRRYREPISITRLQEDLYSLDRTEQSTMRNIDASVGDVMQELLDIQSAFNYYRTKLESHTRETDRAWNLIKRQKTGASAPPVRPKPLPYRVFKSSKLGNRSANSCENLSTTGSGIDRRWNISMSRLNTLGDPNLSPTGKEQQV